jgi:hypothetical protein
VDNQACQGDGLGRLGQETTTSHPLPWATPDEARYARLLLALLGWFALVIVAMGGVMWWTLR